jgi:arsenite transporter
MQMTDTANRNADNAATPLLNKLSTLDRFLPVWIIAAMGLGLALGRIFPSLQTALDSVKIAETSLPIALGLLLMMYPVLAKVNYSEIGRLTGDRTLLWLSLILNWIIGPALMFALAWIFLADEPAFRTGLIVIGLARCIAMVLIWNDLACGDREAAALLVAINSVFQILAYALLGTFYLQILPGWLGLETMSAAFSTWDITKAVLIFLGIPLAAGYLTRRIGIKQKGQTWYNDKFIPRISPFALYGLLFTIVIMFALQGEAITTDPLSVAKIAVPLLVYFILMWGISFWMGMRGNLGYPKTATLAFTAAGNNFELAIAVSIGVWGVTSGQALAGVIGPLIEVPALVALVYVSLWLQKRFAR